jgi:hypothetical protein
VSNCTRHFSVFWLLGLFMNGVFRALCTPRKLLAKPLAAVPLGSYCIASQVDVFENFESP